MNTETIEIDLIRPHVERLVAIEQRRHEIHLTFWEFRGRRGATRIREGLVMEWEDLTVELHSIYGALAGHTGVPIPDDYAYWPIDIVGRER